MTRTVAILSLATLSLLGCASQVTEDHELPDVLLEGAADSWSHPTRLGTLFQQTWQFGELSPRESMRNVAYTFHVDAQASIEITTRAAPVSPGELELSRTVVYLYEQTGTGSFRRIAKTAAGESFGVLAREIGAGTYRLLVKGVSAEDAGQFMIRFACEGDGCADGPQCLFGDTYPALREAERGAIRAGTQSELSVASRLSEAAKAQIIAAVRQSTHEPTTVEEAFDVVDQNVIYRDNYLDNLAGRRFHAFEYGAGDNSFGAIFAGEAAAPVAIINDGDIYECKVDARTCVFGRTMREAEFMPDLEKVRSRDVTPTSSTSALLRAQLIAAATRDGEVPTFAEVFEATDDNAVYVTDYRHTDGREFVEVLYYAGDTAVGAYFAKGSATKLGVINDDEIDECSAF